MWWPGNVPAILNFIQSEQLITSTFASFALALLLTALPCLGDSGTTLPAKEYVRFNGQVIAVETGFPAPSHFECLIREWESSGVE